MDCQHCQKTFSDVAEFEAHSLWHTERQANLHRRPRKYYANHERSLSASTNQSVSSNSDIFSQYSPGSTTTVESPFAPSNPADIAKSPIESSDYNFPEFDFNFGIPSSTAPVGNQQLPIIRTLEDVIARFPALEVEDRDAQSHLVRDYRCSDCEAIFSTQEDCDLHTSSRYCPGSAAIAFALYRDVHHRGGYRIDKKYLPFEGKHSTFKCRKCHLSFSDRLSKKVHERSHVSAQIGCIHCQEVFSTSTELEVHYQWHDDMEYRHHRDKCRRKLPGLKLHSRPSYRRSSRSDVTDSSRKSVFLTDETMAAIPEQVSVENRSQIYNFELEEEAVAISFISPEDLGKVHAPNGFFREVEPGFLRSDHQTSPVAEALDTLEGKPWKGQGSSLCSSPSTGMNKGDPDDSLQFDKQIGIPTSPPSDLKKSSTIRALFRRTVSEPQLEDNLEKRSSFRKTFRKDFIFNDASLFDSRLMLSAVLRKVSAAAKKRDLKAIRREYDRLMAMKLPGSSLSDSSAPAIQAFVHPEGTLVRDAAGNTRYLTLETVDKTISAWRHIPVANLVKTQVSVLTTRAHLSTQVGEYGDAFWCYQQVLDLLQEHPILFPDVIWHAAILSNLAHLSARLNRPEDEAGYYLKALAISYDRYGRKDLNNINFLTALGAAYEKNDQTTRAAEVFKRSLFARMEISGPGENDTLIAMQALAAVYCKLGCLTLAKILYEQCLGGFETQLGLDHKVTLLVVDRICDVYIQLQARDEALALYVRAFPHLRAICEADDELSQNWVSRYIQHTENYDLPRDVTEILQVYRMHPSERNLWVLQSLARVYTVAGLLHDAAETFEFIYNARCKIQGEHDPATLDALHGHCLALECMDDIDAAHNAYTSLTHLALRSPDGNNGKVRAINVRIRLGALQERKKILAGEKEAWGLKTQGPCGTCNHQTSLLCQRCQISRFCCEACRDLASRSHSSVCHPSVTLCQSKSVTAVPGVPQRIEKQFLERLSYQNLRKGTKALLYRVSNSFTFSYDPRNFTTFRLKFNSAVDTFISFDRDADIRFAIIDPSASLTARNLETISTTPHNSSLSITSTHLHALPPRSGTNRSAPPSSRTSWETERPSSQAPSNSNPSPCPSQSTSTSTTPSPFQWTHPGETATLLLPKGKDVYLLVTPGEKLFHATVAKRRKVRMGDSAGLEALTVPDEGLVGYSQGLVLKGVEKRRFAYLVEVER